jgi:hypothetical protein
MRLLPLCAALLTAAPAWAFQPGTHGTPFEGRVHLTQCLLDGSESAGCTLAVAGGFFSVWADAETEGALLESLAALPFGTALDITGDISGAGDGVGQELVLASATPVPDDALALVMAMMRGVWEDPASPGLTLRIDGVDWQELNPEGDDRFFVASYGTACADGTAVDGVAVWLQERAEGGVTPGPCYQAQPTKDGTLTLINQGNGRGYGYARVDFIE